MGLLNKLDIRYYCYFEIFITTSVTFVKKYQPKVIKLQTNRLTNDIKESSGSLVSINKNSSRTVLMFSQFVPYATSTLTIDYI